MWEGNQKSGKSGDLPKLFDDFIASAKWSICQVRWNFPSRYIGLPLIILSYSVFWFAINEQLLLHY